MLFHPLFWIRKNAWKILRAVCVAIGIVAFVREVKGVDLITLEIDLDHSLHFHGLFVVIGGGDSANCQTLAALGIPRKS